MKKCVLCGESFHKKQLEYTYEDYLRENGRTDGYCSECVEILRVQRAKTSSKKKKKKHKIKSSDYVLPGFVWSDKYSCYIKPRKDKNWRSLRFGKRF